MSYSLTNTDRQYRISICDGLISLFTGLSGIPYSYRHWKLSNHCELKYRLGHRLIAILEGIPAVGGLVSLTERIVVCISKKFFTPKQSPNSSRITIHVENPKPISSILSPVSVNVTGSSKISPALSPVKKNSEEPRKAPAILSPMAMRTGDSNVISPFVIILDIDGVLYNSPSHSEVLEKAKELFPEDRRFMNKECNIAATYFFDKTVLRTLIILLVKLKKQEK